VNGSGLKKGDTVVVFGVGGVGIRAVMCAKSFGAEKNIAVDLVDSKLLRGSTGPISRFTLAEMMS